MEPYWSRTPQVQRLSSYVSPHNLSRSPYDIVLYNCQLTPHYDLLVTPVSRLALFGTVEMRDPGTGHSLISNN